MAKYTTKSYINIAKEKYNDRFDFSQTNYVNSYHKIKVKCIEHNKTFEVSPIMFIKPISKGNFCSECFNNKKISHLEFLEKIQKYKDIYDLSLVKYNTKKDNIKLICSTHGVFETQAKFLTQKGIKILCKKCIKSNKSNSYDLIKNISKVAFYKIKVTHLQSKLEWIKIGITHNLTKEIHKNYKNFYIEVIDEIYDTKSNIIKLKLDYKLHNKQNRFYLPSYIKFNGSTNCYILSDKYQLLAKQVKIVRDGLLEKQNGICPICTKEVKMPTLDHFHSKSHNGCGKIRGVICNNCNRFLGVLENKSVMNGIDFTDLPNLLRKIADYTTKEHYNLVHPTEMDKPKKLSKKNYNKLKKIYNEELFVPKRKNQKKKDFPKFPSSGKPIKILVELFKKFNIPLYN